MTLLHSLISRLVFVYSGDSYLTSGGNTYLRDHGPRGLHAQFAAGAASPTPQLDGSLSFDGGDYLTLPLRFYDAAPTGPYTWLAISALEDTAYNCRLFSCWATSGGNNFGFLLSQDTGSAASVVTLGFAGGAGSNLASTNSYPLGSSCRRAVAATFEPAPRCWIDGAVDVSYAFAVGAYAATVYDPTAEPRIGRLAGGAPEPIIGRLYYLALLDGVPTTPDLLDLNRAIREGGRPWCNNA